jgi:integrase
MSATANVLSRYMVKRPGSAMWQLRKPVPADVQTAFGKVVVTKSLGTSNDRDATKAAMMLLEELEECWDAIRSGSASASPRGESKSTVPGDLPEHTHNAIIKDVYTQAVDKFGKLDNARFKRDRIAHNIAAEERRLLALEQKREVRAGDVERYVGPTERLLTKHGVVVDREAPWYAPLVRNVAVAALEAQDKAISVDRGEHASQPASEVVRLALGVSEQGAPATDIPFAALVDRFMKQWLAARHGGKDTNTEQQKRATFRLFGGFFDDQPIRRVRHEDAANFFDTVRLFDPHWARSPSARELSWSQLIERHGDRERGLSDATMNRHLQVLQELWLWSKKRGHCDGENPFEGFHKKLRAGVNVKPYVAWEDDELRQLLCPTPKRSDLLEVILVGMFTGMRLDEIASLTWSQVRQSSDGGTIVHYFQVEDAKTPAGNRKVPVHADLAWLLSRPRGAPSDRLWPTFNEEGRGKKAGNDAGREFSRFKTDRGFVDRTKTFHSFRKNVTRMMERSGVPENDWAQIFGHERGFTYKVYNPDGIDMRQRADIIARISYPGIEVPHPVC